jgi:hypothetical protein
MIKMTKIINVSGSMRKKPPISFVRHHIEKIILPTPFTRKPPPQDEGESWMSSSQGSMLAEGRKQEEDSKPLA